VIVLILLLPLRSTVGALADHHPVVGAAGWPSARLPGCQARDAGMPNRHQRLIFYDCVQVICRKSNNARGYSRKFTRRRRTCGSALDAAVRRVAGPQVSLRPRFLIFSPDNSDFAFRPWRNYP
jgi:hypothetical protein